MVKYPASVGDWCVKDHVPPWIRGVGYGAPVHRRGYLALRVSEVDSEGRILSVDGVPDGYRPIPKTRFYLVLMGHWNALLLERFPPGTWVGPFLREVRDAVQAVLVEREGSLDEVKRVYKREWKKAFGDGKAPPPPVDLFGVAACSTRPPLPALRSERRRKTALRHGGGDLFG